MDMEDPVHYIWKGKISNNDNASKFSLLTIRNASFANCIKTMRSTSGSICYYRSCPIAWRSNRQGVRAYSTAESEYIAASDTIVLSETNGFMTFFEKLPL